LLGSAILIVYILILQIVRTQSVNMHFNKSPTTSSLTKTAKRNLEFTRKGKKFIFDLPEIRVTPVFLGMKLLD